MLNLSTTNYASYSKPSFSANGKTFITGGKKIQGLVELFVSSNAKMGKKPKKISSNALIEKTTQVPILNRPLRIKTIRVPISATNLSGIDNTFVKIAQRNKILQTFC